MQGHLRAFQRPQRSKMADSRLFPGGCMGKSIQGLAWQDQFSAQKFMEREALKENKVCTVDWAPVKQSNTNLQTNSRISRGLLQGVKQASWLQYYWQEWSRLTQDPWVLSDNQRLQDPILKSTTKYQNSSFLIFERGTKVEIQSLLNKGAIRKPKSGQGFVNIFLVLKSRQRWRFILKQKYVTVPCRN